MVDLDAIIDRFMVKPEEVAKALSNVANSFDEHYTCEDGFTVTYNEVKAKALYYFPGHHDRPLEAVVSTAHRDYFLKVGYWKPA